MKKFAIVILNWNGLKDTIECVHSILDTRYAHFEIFCLDNGSTKDEYSSLKSIFQSEPTIKILQSEKNKGFAGGNNFVVSKIPLDNFDYIFLLNNDTIVKNNFFEEINQALTQVEGYGVGMFVPTIYYYNTNLKEEKIWRADDWGKLADTTKTIQHPVGCAMVIKTEIIKKLGLFKNDFFAYGEEVEFTYRLKKQRFNIYYIPRAIIWHKVIEHKDSKFKIYMVARNKWYYFYCIRNKEKPLYLLYLLFLYNIKKILSYSESKESLTTFLKGNMDGIKWIITGKKPINPFIIENE